MHRSIQILGYFIFVDLHFCIISLTRIDIQNGGKINKDISKRNLLLHYFLNFSNFLFPLQHYAAFYKKVADFGRLLRKNIQSPTFIK